MGSTVVHKKQVEIMNNTVIILMGPTGCGKTNLAISLSKKIPLEIINVDSAQVYIGMDIGTNKPNKAELNMAKHYLIDICHPRNHYSVAKFCDDASLLINKIHAEGKIPLLVGGTMLYFYALCFGLNDLPSSEPSIRQQIDLEANKYGWKYLYDKLASIDPELADKIEPNDKQRIQRGLEIFMLTGNKMSSYFFSKKQMNFLNGFDVKYFAIAYEKRDLLHEQIASRFYSMLNNGFMEEVSWLLEQNIPLNAPSMRCVGYRQLAEYLQNVTDRETAYQNAINATRQLAKRQYTWLRRWKNLVDLNFLSSESCDLENLRLIISNIKC